MSQLVAYKTCFTVLWQMIYYVSAIVVVQISIGFSDILKCSHFREHWFCNS